MRTFKTTQRTLMTAATVSLVSVLALGSIAGISGANAAEPTIAVARQFLADLEENRFAFLGSDVPEVVLTASNICSSDGGNGCQYLAVVTRAMPDAVNAARSQGEGKDLDEMIDSFDLPANIRTVIAEAVSSDMEGVGRGANEITVSIGDEFDFVALLTMLDFAINSTKANIDRIGN
ncbi:MAG: hypothetical protein O7C63_05705 [Alphaproteobacteria bacterium]|nr:hypothetical protein [Alphaproteobacteria bacterium]